MEEVFKGHIHTRKINHIIKYAVKRPNDRFMQSTEYLLCFVFSTLDRQVSLLWYLNGSRWRVYHAWLLSEGLSGR